MYTHIIINKENVIIICMNTRVQIKINQFVCWSGTDQNQKKKKVIIIKIIIIKP
jgi:hypothetical protein